LGGRLEIVSLLGDGSRLRVTIPLAAPAPGCPEASPVVKIREQA
jgi:hypothetical protein